VSTLDFMHPDRAVPNGDFSPVLRSSMERRQRTAGAVFEERDGWLVPVSIAGEAARMNTAGIADLSHLGKLEVRGGGDPLDAEEIVAWYEITPQRALVVCAYREVDWLRSRLDRTFKLALDQTAALCLLALVGPDAPAVLRRLTHLHEFPASGSVAHVGAHVLEQNGGFWILFPQEYGHYLWEVAVDAATPFGGGPVGTDTAMREKARA
jgi:glycine cleavage system aminomethyltransferase T